MALAYLAQTYPAAAESCAEFWRAVVDPNADAGSENMANIRRSVDCTANFNGICRAAGVSQTIHGWRFIEDMDL